MKDVRDLRRRFTDASALHTHLAVCAFVDEGTFLTKSGAVGVAHRCALPDDACAEPDELAAVSRRFAQALRLLDPSFRVYTYLLTTPAVLAPPAPHPVSVVQTAFQRRSAHLAASIRGTYDAYLVILHEGWAPGHSAVGEALRRLVPGFSDRRRTAALAGELGRAVSHLHARADLFAAHVTDAVRPVRLDRVGTFRFLRALLNPDPQRAAHDGPVREAHVDVLAADSTVECEPDALVIDGYGVRVLTMKEPPARTWAHVLGEILDVPSRFVACVEWNGLPSAQVRREIHSRRRHFFNRKVSLLNYINAETRPEEMLSDESAGATVHDLGMALSELDGGEDVYGACSVSVVLLDRDARRLDQSVTAVTKAFVAHDGAVHDETYNRLHAWLATMPGNDVYNVRRLLLLNAHCADLAWLFAPSAGDPFDPSDGGPCLAIVETERRSPYHWSLHHGDVGHTAVFGATGSGKSFLVNFLLLYAQRYEPVSYVFDIGGSYTGLVDALGGAVWRFGTQGRRTPLNPFAHPPTAAYLDVLQHWLRVLVQSGDGYVCAARDDLDLREAIEAVYLLAPAQRRLGNLARTLPRALGARLHRWVGDGEHAHVFDNEADALTVGTCQAFDFQGLEATPLVLEPLLFYLWAHVHATIRDDATATRLKLVVCDEAWRFAKDPTVGAALVDALKTWRKHRAALVLATQSDTDLGEGSDLLTAVLENCPTKLFLANPGLDLGRASARFHLSAREAERITDLRPRDQFLLKRPDRSTVLSLRVDPDTERLLARRPVVSSKEVQA